MAKKIDKAIGAKPELSYLVERGNSGLKHFSGMVNEEFLKELQGQAGIKLLGEMRDNHPVIGGFMHAIEMLVRNVQWTIEAVSDKPEDVENADFVSSCLDDMEVSWQDTISEILSFLVFGFSYHEICYKIRSGPGSDDPLMQSRYKDGKIGWSKIAGRSQDSLYRWDITEDGRIIGMYQHVTEGEVGKGGYERYIPMAKAMLFRTKSYKNNPHGRSILRNAVVPYIAQRKIEEIERIGIERDLAGFPVLYAPGDIMGPSASAEEKALFNTLKSLVQDVRRDKAEGIVLPSDVFPETSQQMYKLELLSTAGARQFDTTEILSRQDSRIAMVVLADFILLGHSNVGTYSLGESKTDMFAVALGAFLDIIAEEFNRRAIPDLLKLNGRTPDECPMLKHGDLDEMDLMELGQYVSTLAGAGMPLFPDPALEKHLRDVAHLPEPSLDVGREVGTGTGDDMSGTAAQSDVVQQVINQVAAKKSFDKGEDNGGGNPNHDPATGQFAEGGGSSGEGNSDNGNSFGGWDGHASFNPETGKLTWENPTPLASKIINETEKLPEDKTQGRGYKQNPLPRVERPTLPKDFEERVKDGHYKLEQVSPNKLVSHQEWVDDYRLVRMTTTTPSELREMSDSKKYPTAIKLPNGKYNIIDGNHRAVLNMFLGKPTTLRVVDISIKKSFDKGEDNGGGNPNHDPATGQFAEGGGSGETVDKPKMVEGSSNLSSQSFEVTHFTRDDEMASSIRESGVRPSSGIYGTASYFVEGADTSGTGTRGFSSVPVKGTISAKSAVEVKGLAGFNRFVRANAKTNEEFDEPKKLFNRLGIDAVRVVGKDETWVLSYDSSNQNMDKQ